jgi:hypothetical protein
VILHEIILEGIFLIYWLIKYSFFSSR